MKDDYVNKIDNAVKEIVNEKQILKSLKHQHIIGIGDGGVMGQVVNPNGSVISGRHFLELEYVSGGLLFDLCVNIGPLGENTGRYFMKQMLSALQHIHGQGVVHRDLKLDNILLDHNMNIKIADFGFATCKNINKLDSFKGTKSYMAPEIKAGKVYDGRHADIFSTGVILFTIVMGVFPFFEALESDYRYYLIQNGHTNKYWQKVNGQHLSPELKDLMMKLFSVEGKDRPTLDQIQNHPWMQAPCNDNAVRN